MTSLLRMFMLLLFMTCFTGTFAQNDAAIEYNQWKAAWIQVPGEPSNGYGVYLFRKKLDLAAKPSSFRIHVSADNRYKLFVNEKLASVGPARGDIAHWNYETIDIAPLLQAGGNIIAAVVWNEAELRPEAQISFRTGLIVQGATEAEQIINTGSGWKCIRDASYQPMVVRIPNTYYVAGPGEQVTMSAHPRDWKRIDFNDGAWQSAEAIIQGTPKNLLGAFGIPVGWLLVPSTLPQMELIDERLKSVRIAKGVSVPSSFPASKSPFTVPANSKAVILLDQSYLTNAYPTLIFSGGKGASLRMAYAESLYSNYPAKGARNEVEGKQFVGRTDSIISDGSAAQQFTTLNWRTYRYLQLTVNTKQEPIMIDDIYGTFTGFPFKYNAVVESDNPEMKAIMETGWRTARLCAVETYMDCPYYEQLQYIADARIQALVSVYNSGDDRLIKNALNLMDHSRQPEGITYSRHPSHSPQYIPTFSLWYIGMLSDYWMYGPDTNFAKDKLAGARQVLNYFHRYQRSDGSLANVPYWMFTDWVERPGWVNGAAPMSADSSSANVDLQLLYAYQVAANMEEKSGMKEFATLYNKYAARLKNTIRKKYWDASKGMYADRMEKDVFSQHANTLAILTGLISGNEATALAKKIVADTSLAQASIYFKYYLHRALIKAGLGNDYMSWLSAWRENLKMGLTTWGESPDINTTRSDCHAWGSSPNIEFIRTIVGIDSDAPGFSRVRVEPHPGSLANIKCEMPHPKGKISAEYVKRNNKWSVSLDLPPGLSGSLIWGGKSYRLKPGKNTYTL